MPQLLQSNGVQDFVLSEVIPAALVLGVTSCCVYLYLWYTGGKRLPLPPGPPGNPFTGNIRSVSVPDAPKLLAGYKEQYGDLVMFQGMGNRILVLNSLKAMNDLFDKRAHIYSNRPHFVFAGELLELNQGVVLLQYGDEWRAHRKLLHTTLSTSQVKKYYGLQEDIAASLCKELVENSDGFHSLTRVSAGRIIIGITYGIPASPAQREYIMGGERSAGIFIKAVSAGRYMCDLIPILKYAPSFVPFKREARMYKDILRSNREKPFNHVKREMAAGTALSSFVQTLLSSPPEDMAYLEYERRVLAVASSMFGAGVETVHGSILTFLLAMALHQDKQSLAQKELDTVIGSERLPTVNDRTSLPYVNALIKETMRWRPVTPTGIPRRSVEDDVYDNYHIPKGTVIMPNVWAVSREPNDKYEVEAFIPERFLDPTQDIPDPSSWLFGFGRRICPGRHLAENSLFIIVATMLTVFNISPPKDGTIPEEFTSGTGRITKEFQCCFTSRSDDRAQLVQARAATSVF